MQMTKNEIVEAVNRSIDLPKNETIDIVDSLFEMVRGQLEKGDDVKIPRFGNFSIREKHERVGRNPKTGVSMPITARKVVTFKPSNILRDRVNR
jgi:integration host factor subunit alpha